MNNSISLLGAGMLCAALSTAVCMSVMVSGCASNGSSGGRRQQQPYQQQQQGPYSDRGMSAPVVLNLRGPTPTPSSGQFNLDLEIVANEPIQAPVSLRVQLPQGTMLVAGMPSETINLPQAGNYYRRYVVQTQGPLNQPIVVEADAQGPNNTWGFNARRQYPAVVNQPIGGQQRPPSGGRPPVVRP